MKKWTVGMPDRKVISKLILGCGVTSLTAAALAQKGYTSPEAVMESLNSDELSSPFLIKEKGQEYRSHRCPRLNPPPFGHPNPPGPLSRGNGGRLGMTWLLIPEEKREKSTRNPPKFRIFEA